MAYHFHVLTNLFPPDALGGYELLARDVVSGLQAHGHAVTAITTGRGHGEAGIARILRLARPFGAPAGRDRIRHWAAAAHNRKAINRHFARAGVPDAVLVMSLRRLGLEPLRAYLEAGVPLVFTVNDDWPVAFVERAWAASRGGRMRAAVARSLDALAGHRHTWRGLSPDRVVYLSDMIRRLVRDAGAPFPEGQVCAQGVDRSLFVRRAPRTPRPSPQFLFVGRLHPSKAPDVALDAVAAMRKRGADAHLTMVGAPVSKEYGNELRRRAHDLGIEAAVTWRGQVPRVTLPGIYAEADAVLYPLRGEIEAQGLTFMEAMAVGTPVIAFPTAGARELLEGADVVVRAARCDGEAFADAALPFLANPARVLGLVDSADAWLERHASLSRYVAVLEGQLGAAVGHGRTSRPATESPLRPPARPGHAARDI